MRRHGLSSIEFLLNILLALAVFGFVVAGISRCTRLSDQAENSFRTMVEDIQTMQEGEVINMHLYLDEGTRIVVWPAYSKKVKYDVAPSAKGHMLGSCTKEWEVERPKQCPLGKPCACRCKKDDSPECSEPQCDILDLGKGKDVAPSSCTNDVDLVAHLDKSVIGGPISAPLFDMLDAIPGGLSSMCAGSVFVPGVGWGVTAVCAGGAAVVKSVEQITIDFKYANCQDGFVVHRYEGEFSSKTGFWKLNVPLNPSCVWNIKGTPREYDAYAQKVNGDLKLCMELSAQGDCLTDEELAKEAMIQQLKEKVVRPIENCAARLGDECGCGTVDLSFMPQGATLLYSGNVDNRISLSINKGQEQLARDVYANAPGCVYDLDAQGEDNIAAVQYNTPLAYGQGLLVKDGSGPVMTLMRHAGKVCAVVHDDTTAYVSDDDQNIDRFGAERIFPGCLYP